LPLLLLLLHQKHHPSEIQPRWRIFEGGMLLPLLLPLLLLILRAQGWQRLVGESVEARSPSFLFLVRVDEKFGFWKIAFCEFARDIGKDKTALGGGHSPAAGA
jgi:hypothetical protein